MKIVCAWCGTLIAEPTRPGAEISHGMCLECQHTFLEQRGVGLRELTNQSLAPVLVVNEAGAVIHANDAASVSLGNPSQLIEGKSAGFVIRCDRAKAAGGCGTSRYCDACRLRDAIKETHADGRPRYGVVAESPLTGPRKQEFRPLHFSTLRASNAVVLLLERRGEPMNPAAMPRVECACAVNPPVAPGSAS